MRSDCRYRAAGLFLTFLLVFFGMTDAFLIVQSPIAGDETIVHRSPYSLTANASDAVSTNFTSLNTESFANQTTLQTQFPALYCNLPSSSGFSRISYYKNHTVFRWLVLYYLFIILWQMEKDGKKRSLFFQN